MRNYLPMDIPAMMQVPTRLQPLAPYVDVGLFARLIVGAEHQRECQYHTRYMMQVTELRTRRRTQTHSAQLCIYTPMMIALLTFSHSPRL